MNLRTTSAIGHDVVFAIDPEVYELTRTGDGVGYAFRMDDETRQQLAAGVRHVLERPQDIADLELHPGYIRVRVESPADTSPKDVVDELRGLPRYYNERHAQSPEFDGLEFADRYVGAYRPDGAPTSEEYLATRTGSDAAPEADGPVFKHERTPALAPQDRHLAYEYVFPFDAEETYARLGRRSPAPDARFEWDDHVLGVLEIIVNDVPMWPGSTPEEIARIAVFPEYMVVRHYSHSLHAPEVSAIRAYKALRRFNRYRGVREDFTDGREKVLQPPIVFSESAYIGAIPPADGGAEAWITARGLDEEDGEPRGPEPLEEFDADADVDDAGADADDGDSGRWRLTNPFGRGWS